MKQNKRGIILVGVILAMMLSALDQTIVATAMPQIVDQFNALSHLSWVFTAYMLTSTITVPIYGKLSDIFGRRGLYILGIVVFLAGSMLSGLSRDMTQLIFFRGLQGIGGGAMMVNAFAVVGDLFSPAERGKWQGVMGGIFGLATILGPLLGGWITDSFSWRWIFYINVPVGILAIAVLASAMPKIPKHERERSIDYPGAVLIAAGLVPLLLAFVWAGVNDLGYGYEGEMRPNSLLHTNGRFPVPVVLDVFFGCLALSLAGAVLALVFRALDERRKDR